MPPGTDGCEAETTVEYQEMKVGTGEFLLPVRSSMRMVKADVTETLNTASYFGRREYHADATIRFDSEALAGGSPTTAAPASPLPPGLSLSVSLRSPIDTDTAAAGAKVEGRIVQMQHWLEKPRRFTICVVLESLEVRGIAAHAVCQAESGRRIERCIYRRGASRPLRQHLFLSRTKAVM